MTDILRLLTGLLLNVVGYIFSQSKATVVSVSSAMYGSTVYANSLANTLLPQDIDNLLQRSAWTAAIIATIVAVINGTKDWKIKRTKKKPEK